MSSINATTSGIVYTSDLGSTLQLQINGANVLSLISTGLSGNVSTTGSFFANNILVPDQSQTIAFHLAF